MGLAINLVGAFPEKVWFHKCGKPNCFNTQLVERGGCCIWYNEKQVFLFCNILYPKITPHT